MLEGVIMVLSCRLYLLGIFYLVSANNGDIPVELNDNLTVTIEDGTIQGRKDATVGQGKVYYAFQGIPYAEPPIGERRFKPPEKNSQWKGTLNATQDKSECVQGGIPVQGSEDCLYINVYTPSLTSKNVPVMVWIHGGGFMTGNSSYRVQGPDYLLDEGVIFVQFNYRLGVFGFISTEDLECPGNLGLKDQVLALKWVQRNIKFFGGDPAQVTIFGESAGSSSVSYLLQMNATRGLFKAAIMESGTSLCLWSLNRKAREIAFGIGLALGIGTSSSKALINGLRKINYAILQQVSTIVSTAVTLHNLLAFTLGFSPVKEPYHDGAVFYNKSEELLSQGLFHHVPVLAGFNSNEAAAVGDITGLMRLYLTKYDIKSTGLAPADLTTNATKKRIVGQAIKDYYFDNLPLSAQTNSVIKFISDDQFNRPIRQTVKDQSKYSPVYFYKFSYEGVLGGQVNRTLRGVGHAEELGYIFRTYHRYVIPASDAIIRSRMVKLWTNFAKYNNPTPTKDASLQNITWLPVSGVSSSLNYLDINTDMELQTNPFNTDMKFWDGIYAKYGDPPYDTY